MTANLKKRAPEREKLAEAIQALAEAKKIAPEMELLEREYLEKKRAAEAELKETESAVDAIKWKEANVKRSPAELVEYIKSSEAGKISNEAHEADEKIKRLSAELQLIKKILSKVSFQERLGAIAGVKRAEEKLRDALYLVVDNDPAVTALVEKFRRLQVEANAVKDLVKTISWTFGGKLGGWDSVPDAVASEQTDEWRRVFDLLKTDPDAAFPEVE